jgi:hypothetical protein
MKLTQKSAATECGTSWKRGCAATDICLRDKPCQ